MIQATRSTLTLAAVVLLAGCASVEGGSGVATPAAAGRAGHWADLEPLTPIPTALLFHRNSEVPFPEVELASALPGVCRVEQPEARKEALDAAWDRLRQIDRQTAARRSWLVAVPRSLGGYDLRRGAFPTGLGRDSGPSFGRQLYCGQAGMGYAVALVNWKAFEFVAVGEARAREFVRANMQRDVTLELEVEVAGAEPGATQTLLLRILRLRVRDAATGGDLAEAVAR
jgi:hypothetical protein